MPIRYVNMTKNAKTEDKIKRDDFKLIIELSLT